VRGLSVAFGSGTDVLTAVRGLDLDVRAGETVAIVGESGSGKSVTSLAITRLIDHAGGRIVAGRIGFRGRDGRLRDLATKTPEAMRQLRGPELAMVFQEPMTSLNPVLRVGEQIAEAVMANRVRMTRVPTFLAIACWRR
jgi:glutathione transport system ATP-binding protein